MTPYSIDNLFQEELQKMKKYCVLQERSKSEVRKRLYEKGIYKERAEGIIAQLEEEGFINEERFSEAFIRGKFRINKWGRLKIVDQLKRMQIPAELISKGLEEIDEEEYMNLLKSLVERKNKEMKEKDTLMRKQKLFNYLWSKGFEKELIFSILNENT